MCPPKKKPTWPMARLPRLGRESRHALKLVPFRRQRHRKTKASARKKMWRVFCGRLKIAHASQKLNSADSVATGLLGRVQACVGALIDHLGLIVVGERPFGH